ncbi:hypothetical protein QI30_15710 [Kurthia sp. 3B1D]|uniref:Uncharacterized protein n=2 Tax=Kurthia TaxID=1649 RepID=A0A433RQV5_9BACL|nr:MULTISPECIES: hypothetical protein [Kurthia]MBM7700865.1 hypothetical protein [Kurthia huakuii]RUS53004.1 hypothetical protein QI30_15710 [Kurthia sp. 3B1D]HIX43352.1 hypothetical protein [Candidatus Kurthia intestinigallinarum]
MPYDGFVLDFSETIHVLSAFHRDLDDLPISPEEKFRLLKELDRNPYEPNGALLQTTAQYDFLEQALRAAQHKNNR